MIQSPLNYTGGKYKLLPQILPFFPHKINKFVDLFCGGCNVGINVNANLYIYNDSCCSLINLYSVMQRIGCEEFINGLESVITRYNLSDVKTKGYNFYGCNSSDGLSKYNREYYIKLRRDVNKSTIYNDEYYIKLYALIVYAFNNQIRFNKNGEFNLPPGKRDFNQKMYDKLVKFLNKLHSQNAKFYNFDFNALDLSYLNEKDFVYADPPYLITCASYNEKGGWTFVNECDLLKLLDSLSERNIKFALSNVIESKGKTNEILSDWIMSKQNYRMIDLKYTYKNANYHRQNKESKTREILIINY